jgi:DNA-binding response OmpR family regulator
MQLLLVEDDPKLARFIKKGLTEESFAIDVVGTGEISRA